MATNPEQTTPEQLDYALRHNINPVPFPDPSGRPLSPSSLRRLELHNAYQRARLHGFTIPELQAAGCWEKVDAMPSNLGDDVPIHPLYQKALWVKSGQPIWHGVEGRFTYWNPIVENAMLPVLRLATRLLMNHSLWPWLDALIHGEWKLLQSLEVPDGFPPGFTRSLVHAFYPRPVAERSPHDAVSINEHLEKCARGDTDRMRLVLSFNSIGRKSLRYGWYRATYGEDGHGAFVYGVINLASESVLPLLKGGLTVTERLVQQFTVAKTLVHETMHAIGAYTTSQKPGIPNVKMSEPFYADEVISELGRSWENTCFGGMISTIHVRATDNFDEPALGAYTSPWPNWSDYGDGRWGKGSAGKRFRIQKEGSKISAEAWYWPIPTAFIENIQQSAYWESQSLRAEAFRPPQITGRKRVRGRQSAVMVGGKDYHKWIDKSTFEARELPMLPDNVTDLEIMQMNLEQKARADAINFASFQKADKEMEEALLVREENALEEEEEALAGARKIVDLETEQDCLELFDKLSKSRYPGVAAEANIALAGMDLLRDDVRRKELLESSVETLQNLILKDSSGENKRSGKWAELLKEASDELEKL